MQTPWQVENLGNIIYDNTKEYAKEVGIERVTPSVLDGLKPVQKSLAYAIYLACDKGKTNRHIKCQTVCSDVVGKYHPHGMDSVYISGIKMEGLKGALFESKSKLSLRTTDMYTAPRYTNIGLSELGKELFTTLHLCEMTESEMGYQMPVNLLARFPYHLFTSSINIGVGTSNTQLPLNPKEVIGALTRMLELEISGKEITTEEIMMFIKGPDLYERSTIYMSHESLAHLIERGTGSCIEVCDIEVIEEKGLIIIKELPYGENSPSLTSSILEKSNNVHNKEDVGEIAKIYGIEDSISAVKDESSEEDIRIVIKVDMTDPDNIERVLHQLYTKTGVKSSHMMKYILVEEDGEHLDLFSVRDLLRRSIDVNKLYFTTKYEEALKRLERRLEVNKVLEKVTRPKHTEFVGKAIYEEDKEELLLSREGLELTEYEVREILFKEGRILNRLSQRDQILKEIGSFDEERKGIEESLEETNILKDILKYFNETLKELVKDMGRSTEVVYSPLNKVTPKPKKIRASSEKVVKITTDNLIKSVDNYGGDIAQYLEEGDNRVFTLTEDDFVVVVTESHHVKIQVKELEDEYVLLSTYIMGLSNEVGERILGVFTQDLRDTEDNLYYFINTLGQVKAIEERMLFASTRVSKSTIIEDGISLVNIYKISGEELATKYIILLTQEGYIKLLPLSYYNPKNRESLYNRSLNLGDTDQVIYTGLIDQTDIDKLNIIVNAQPYLLKSDYIKPVTNKGTRLIEGDVDSARLEGEGSVADDFEFEGSYIADEKEIQLVLQSKNQKAKE